MSVAQQTESACDKMIQEMHDTSNLIKGMSRDQLIELIEGVDWMNDGPIESEI